VQLVSRYFLQVTSSCCIYQKLDSQRPKWLYARWELYKFPKISDSQNPKQSQKQPNIWTPQYSQMANFEMFLFESASAEIDRKGTIFEPKLDFRQMFAA
jgi:hypothetical protein